MFLKGNWRYLSLPIPFIVSTVLLANLLYFRNFGDLLQPSSYKADYLNDPFVTRGAITSLKRADILYFILPFLPTAYAILAGRKLTASGTGRRYKMWIGLIFLMSWGICYAGVFRRVGIYKGLSNPKEIAKQVFSKEIINWINAYETHNFTGYLCKCALISRTVGMDLTPADREYVKEYLSKSSQRNVGVGSVSRFSSGKGKNLIMIIVESLPFKIFELEEAATLIPEMKRIVADSATIVSRCKVLAGFGRSSDAQFIYNTGLLPLRSEALVDNYASRHYPSLAKALQYKSLEIIGESKQTWMHYLTTKSYGFDALIDNAAPTGMDQDSILFNTAQQEAACLESPFYLFITTITMHDPYDSRKVSHPSGIITKNTKDPRDLEFLERLHHFDRNLGRFLTDLKTKGILERSVVVILGDHEIRASNVSEYLHDEYVPFIIINAPARPSSTVTTTQLDVFPSVLDILECGYTFKGTDYSGLGESIFSPTRISGRAYQPTDEDYKMSEMIIKGDL